MWRKVHGRERAGVKLAHHRWQESHCRKCPATIKFSKTLLLERSRSFDKQRHCHIHIQRRCHRWYNVNRNDYIQGSMHSSKAQHVVVLRNKEYGRFIGTCNETFQDWCTRNQKNCPPDTQNIHERRVGSSGSRKRDVGSFSSCKRHQFYSYRGPSISTALRSKRKGLQPRPALANSKI